MRIICIGCGPYPDTRPGAINIDINPRHNPQIVRDVRRGLPFDDSSAGEIVTSHFLEHLACDDFIFMIGEIYRVLGDGGLWRIVIPLGATGDFDHKMVFREDSFDCLLREETADYYQLPPMRWREKGRSIEQDAARARVAVLKLKLEAMKP